MYPRLKIYLKRIEENTRVIRQLCTGHGIRVMGVTKACCGAPELAEAYLAGGLAMIGDSRVANLKKLENIEAEKWLIRPPMLSEIEDLVRYADVSLQSEMETVRAINKECEKQGKRHKIILMMDLGDIREGYVDEEELIAAAVETEKLSRVDLYGIGTNLTCFSFIQADEEKMERLAEMRKKVENAAGHTLEIVSGGNSAALDLMMRGGICEGVDNFRLGESNGAGILSCRERGMTDLFWNVKWWKRKSNRAFPGERRGGTAMDGNPFLQTGVKRGKRSSVPSDVRILMRKRQRLWMKAFLS